MDLDLKSRDVLIKEEPFANTDPPFPKQEEDSLKCGICQKQFDSESKLQEHACHSIADSVTCDVDQKPIPCNAAFENNIHSQTVDGSSTTKKFGKIFTQTHDWKKHLYKNTGKKPLACDVCKKSFFYKKTLESHLRTHTDEELYACGKCPVKERKKDGWHLSDPKAFSCHVCQLTLSSNSALMLHLRIHTNDRPFACDKCDKAFNQMSTLKTHLRTHTGEKPYVCDVCQKRFTQKDHLTGHRRLHTGEMPYVCDICHRSFNLSSTLKIHLLTHTGERPYACDYCGRTFTQKVNLTVHLRRHASKK